MKEPDRIKYEKVREIHAESLDSNLDPENFYKELCKRDIDKDMIYMFLQDYCNYGFMDFVKLVKKIERES